MDLDNVALILARAGSKGIPGKNLKLLGGKPLLAWTVEAALGAASVSRVFLTTEDPEIAEVGRKYGAEILKRPAVLAVDEVQSDEVFLYALHQLEHEYNIHPRVLTLLAPTSPFRTSQDIDQAHDLLPPGGSVVSVFQSSKFYWTFDDDNDFVPIQHVPMFRQGRQWRDESEFLYVENGAIYIVTAEDFKRWRTYRVPPFAPFVMPEDRSPDLDSPRDWNWAEFLLPGFLEITR